MSAPHRKIGYLSIPEDKLPSALLAKEAIARARPAPKPVREPTYAQLKAQMVLLRAELAVVRKERDLIRNELLGLQRLLLD